MDVYLRQRGYQYLMCTSGLLPLQLCETGRLSSGAGVHGACKCEISLHQTKVEKYWSEQVVRRLEHQVFGALLNIYNTFLPVKLSDVELFIR
jgi:hypothetical protein